MRTRHTFVATIAVGVVAATGLTAAIAAGPNEAPPKIAFVARGDGSNFADALAVGSIAGQLGAPVFTTSSTTLEPATAAGLDAYNPELVIITGGPVAISDEVRLAIIDATALPGDKVIRAAGADRYATAVEIANILTDLDINTAFLAIDGKAVDAAHADDADTLDGRGPGAYQALVTRSIEGATIPISSGCTGATSVTITVPVAGQVLVTADTTLRLRHANGSDTGAAIYLANAPSTCDTETAGLDSYVSGVRIPSANPTGTAFDQVSTSRIFDVGAGTHTFHLTGSTSSWGASGITDFWFAAITAEFVPAT